MVGEADPPPRRPRHAASPSSAPDGRRTPAAGRFLPTLSVPEQELLRLSVSLMVGEADPPPPRPRHAASPSSAPDGRRTPAAGRFLPTLSVPEQELLRLSVSL